MICEGGSRFVSLRPVMTADEEFLLMLYASTRAEEVAAFGWDSTMQEAFLRMQFVAQKQWYETAYASAEHSIILRDGERIGRWMVVREQAEIRLVDISLLPEWRGLGIGSELIRRLSEEATAAGVPLRLQVLKTNRAQRLYSRLGFSTVGDDQMYYQLER